MNLSYWFVFKYYHLFHKFILLKQENLKLKNQLENSKIEKFNKEIELIDQLYQIDKDIKENRPIDRSIERIQKKISHSLSSEGVQKIVCLKVEIDLLGVKIIKTIIDDNKESGTVLQVFQQGYTYQNQILRSHEVLCSQKSKPQ